MRNAPASSVIRRWLSAADCYTLPSSRRYHYHRHLPPPHHRYHARKCGSTQTLTLVKGKQNQCQHVRVASSASHSSSSRVLHPIKGTHDLFPPLVYAYESVESLLSALCVRANYVPVRTPLLEQAALFLRSLGTDSDIVSKELFSFNDHDTQTILRPEGTAPVIRALINRGMHHIPNTDNGTESSRQVERYYYHGPMFRRERPQKGRYRQFHQFGIEIIGSAATTAELECIELAYSAMVALGVQEAVELHINTIGDTQDRQRYAQALNQFLTPHKELLSVESRNRLERGAVLRVLDSKDTTDIAIISGAHSAITDKAPAFSEYLSPASAKRFELVLNGLKQMNIPFVVNPYLVRGLDYYCHTAFEFVTRAIHTDPGQAVHPGSFAAQSTVLAGGRYDGLCAELGGPPVPAIGWAAGIDRLVLLIQAVHQQQQQPEQQTTSSIPTIAVIAAGATQSSADDSAALSSLYCHLLSLCSRLRAHGFHARHYLERGKTSKQLAAAAKADATVSIIVGEDEMRAGTVQIKDMRQKQQSLVRSEDVIAHVQQIITHTR